MEKLYNNMMNKLGYTEFIGDIFPNWEDVKDEILPSPIKKGSGNGTLHIFLGQKNYDVFKKSFGYSLQNQTPLYPTIKRAS